MRPFRELIPLEKALDIIMHSISPIERVEEISLENSLRRVLAEDIVAKINIPPFSRAAEDGYAVRAEDTFGAGTHNPVKLKIVGEVDAGEVFETPIKKGECVEIATGAPIPKGADAVVRVEDTEKEGDFALIYSPVYPGRSVAPEGEDIKKGEKILERGTVLTPSKIGVLAAIGNKKVRVYAKPEVAIIPTGSEIVPPGEKLSHGKIYDINSYTLAAVVEEAGGLPRIMGTVEDDEKKIRDYLEKALKYDCVVFSGGSSVGTKDLLINIVSEMGEVKFHGVQIKPGKPTWFAVVRGKPVFGLPGFPTSCLSDAYIFLKPAVEKMAHLPKSQMKKVKAVLSRRVVSTLGRTQFLTVRIEKENDRIIAHPVFKTSGAITSMANADGYIMIPSNVDLLEKGEEVEVFLFGI